MLILFLQPALAPQTKGGEEKYKNISKSFATTKI